MSIFSRARFILLAAVMIVMGGSELSAMDSETARKFFAGVDFAKIDSILITSVSSGVRQFNFSISQKNGPRVVTVGKKALWIKKPGIKWVFIISYKHIVYTHRRLNGDGSLYINVE